MRLVCGIILTALILMTSVAYGLAGELFEWGSWGMSLAEVKALHGNVEPVATHTADGEQHIYTYKMHMPAGEAYENSYAFKPVNEVMKLYTVWYAFSFTVENLAEHNAREAELIQALEATLKTRGAYRYAVEKIEDGASAGYQRAQHYWLSDKEFILFATHWYGGETLDGVNSNMDFDFYNMANSATKEIASKLVGLKWRDLK